MCVCDFMANVCFLKQHHIASCWEDVFNVLPAYGGFHKIGYPQIIHLKRIFHCKPSILGYPHFRKPPCSIQSPLYPGPPFWVVDQHSPGGIARHRPGMSGARRENRGAKWTVERGNYGQPNGGFHGHGGTPVPQNGWFLVENPNLKWVITGVHVGIFHCLHNQSSFVVSWKSPTNPMIYGFPSFTSVDMSSMAFVSQGADSKRNQ